MKKEFKGTKGKWKAVKMDIAKGDVYLIIDKESYQVAIADNRFIKDAETVKANARLISHAPEMLEKLEECIVMFNKKKRLTTTDMSIMINEINELLTRATTI